VVASPAIFFRFAEAMTGHFLNVFWPKLSSSGGVEQPDPDAEEAVRHPHETLPKDQKRSPGQGLEWLPIADNEDQMGASHGL
jgi:hypothetical protein